MGVWLGIDMKGVDYAQVSAAMPGHPSSAHARVAHAGNATSIVKQSFLSNTSCLVLMMMFNQKPIIAREEPVMTSYIYEMSALSRFEHAAQCSRARPPARAISFCTRLHDLAAVR